MSKYANELDRLIAPFIHAVMRAHLGFSDEHTNPDGYDAHGFASPSDRLRVEVRFPLEILTSEPDARAVTGQARLTRVLTIYDIREHGQEIVYERELNIGGKYADGWTKKFRPGKWVFRLLEMAGPLYMQQTVHQIGNAIDSELDRAARFTPIDTDVCRTATGEI